MEKAIHRFKALNHCKKIITERLISDDFFCLNSGDGLSIGLSLSFWKTIIFILSPVGINPRSFVREFDLLPFGLQGQSDKYIASPPDGVTIAREMYYRVVHSRRRLLSKFQPNRIRSFVLTACGMGRVRGFLKNGERAISVDDLTLVLRWRPSKIGLTSFNVVARRFLMSHAQVPRKRLPRRITWQNSTISYWQTAEWRYAR